MSRQVIAGYELLAKLGEGGGGAVYKANQESLDRLVALKILPHHLVSDEQDIERFKMEAKAAAKLDHQGIAKVYDAGECEGQYYFAMEYIDGNSLHDWIDEMGVIPEEEALVSAECIAEALEYAWDKEEIVHRDIKPDNVLLNEEGVIKIIDLGLAKTSAAKKRNLTIVGESMGTPNYCSPEQARGDAVDCRADIYSLGAMLYHMVTGVIPFEEAEGAGAMVKHVTDYLEDPRDLNPALSGRTSKLIAAMMAKDADDRYDNWTEVLEDIHRVMDNKFPAQQLIDGAESTVALHKQTSTTSMRTSAVAEQLQSQKSKKDLSSKMPLIVTAAAAACLILVLGGMGIKHKMDVAAERKAQIAAAEQKRIAEEKEEAAAKKAAAKKKALRKKKERELELKAAAERARKERIAAEKASQQYQTSVSRETPEVENIVSSSQPEIAGHQNRRNPIIKLMNVDIPEEEPVVPSAGSDTLDIPKDGLLLCWTFDNKTSDDDSGNGRHGESRPANSEMKYSSDTPDGTGMSASFKNGQCIWWKGEDRMSFTSFTCAFNCKGWPEDNGGYARFGWGHNPKKPDHGSTLLIHRDGGSSNQLMVNLFWYGTITKNTPLTDGEWHHVVTVFDEGKMRLYVDGKLLGENVYEKELVQRSIGRVAFGASLDDARDPSRALMDNILVYDRALSAQEITALTKECGP